MTGVIALAATAGVLAAFNPCGFALLPTYLALFLGTPASRTSGVRRAVVVGASVTVGFVAVFAVVGVALVVLSLSLGPWLSYVTIASGVVLLGVGAWLASGRDLALRVPRARLAVSETVPGMVAYGVVYATVSLSCTLPVFLATVVYVFGAPDAGPLRGGLAAVSYAAGMGMVLTALALVAALVGQAATARLRRGTAYVARVSGVVALAAGAYVVWYGVVERAVLGGGGGVPGGPVAWVGAASSGVSRAVAALGLGGVALGTAGLFVGAVVWGRVRRHR